MSNYKKFLASQLVTQTKTSRMRTRIGWWFDSVLGIGSIKTYTLLAYPTGRLSCFFLLQLPYGKILTVSRDFVCYPPVNSLYRTLE